MKAINQQDNKEYQIRHFRNRNEYASTWHKEGRAISEQNLTTGNLDNGKGTLGTPQQRQDALVGLTLNAAMMSAVYNELKAGRPFSELWLHKYLRERPEEIKVGHCIPDNVRTFNVIRSNEWSNLLNGDECNILQTLDKIRALADSDGWKELDRTDKWRLLSATVSNIQEELKSENPQTVQKAEQELFTIVRLMDKENFINRHRDVLDERRWEVFNDLRKNNRTMEDSRIASMKTWLDPYFTIITSGEKAEERINDKLANLAAKNGKADIAMDILDSVRVTVAPSDTGTANIFYKFLESRMPSKKSSEDRKDYTSRIFQRPYEIKKQGLFDGRVYVAMDRLHNVDENDLENTAGGNDAEIDHKGRYHLKGVNGIIAEIRVLPQKLAVLEQITHALYEVSREVELIGKKIQKGEDFDYEALQNLYNNSKEKYESEQKNTDVRRPFPELISEQDLNDHDKLNNYVADIRSHTREIYTLFMALPSMDESWREEIVKTSYRMKEEKGENQGLTKDEMFALIPDKNKMNNLKTQAIAMAEQEQLSTTTMEI